MIFRRAALVLAALASCRGAGAGVDVDAGAPDAAPGAQPRHEAGPYKAYFGTLHDHHYGKNAGDDGGLAVGAPDEPGATGSAEWFAYRRENPQYYVGGDAASAFAAARAAGLDFFALTPHNHLIDSEEYGAVVLAARDVEGMVALHGQEWSSISSGNHASVLNVETRVSVPNGQYDALIDEWLPGYRASHPASATSFAASPFMIFCHPAFQSSDYGPDEKALLEYGIDDFGGNVALWAEAMNREVRLVEIMSGPTDDETNLQRVMEILNDGVRVGFSVGPDNHRQLWGERNESRAGVLAESWTREGISEALHARRSYASEDRDLGAHLAAVDDAGAVLGWTGEEIARPGDAIRLEIGLEDPTDPSETYRIEVRADDAIGGAQAMVISESEPLGEGTHVLTTAAPPAGGYLVVHVTAGDGDDLWFSPLWID